MEQAEAEAVAAAQRPIHKMTELRMACLKEIRIRRQRLELAKGSFRDSLRSIKSVTEENQAKREKLGELKDYLRKLETDLADAISVLGAREEKSNEDMNETKDIEDAILWYKRVLGFRTEGGEGVKFIFNNIVLENADEEFAFTIRLEGDIYKLMNCDLRVEDIDDLIKDLNKTNDLFKFVRIMRERFQAAALNVDNSGIVETLHSWANSKQIRELEETSGSEEEDIEKLVDAMDAGAKDSDRRRFS